LGVLGDNNPQVVVMGSSSGGAGNTNSSDYFRIDPSRASNNSVTFNIPPTNFDAPTADNIVPDHYVVRVWVDGKSSPGVFILILP
jgi:hypothetical protein